MASTLLQSSQKSKASAGMITGMRGCSVARSRLAAAVTMAAVSSSSPWGPIQVSHSPAKATGARSFGRTQKARLRPASSFHS